MNRAHVQLITLKRVDGGDYHQIEPVLCSDFAQANRCLSRMARQHPPTGNVPGDRVDVRIEWELGLSYDFSYFLTSWAAKGCRVDGALQGSLEWEAGLGVERAAHRLQYCDLGGETAELLAA
jgi:hypothetical protein